MMTPQELKERIRGVFIVTMTPFNDDGSFNDDGYRKNLRFLVEKCKGEDVTIVATGSTGEFYAMTDEECKQVARVTVETVNGELPVLIGTARAGTRATLEMSQYAQSIGADGVMIVLPYYHIPSSDGLYRHFEQIAAGLDIGIMLYNNPITSKIWVDPELMVRISKIPNVVAVKENISDVAKYLVMKNKVDPEDVRIIYGLGEIYYSFAALYGCPGFISSIANFAPELSIDLYKSAMARRFDDVVAAVERIMPFNRAIALAARNRGTLPDVLSPAISLQDHPVYQSATKVAMDLVGLVGGKVREPMDSLTESEVDDVRRALEEMGLI